MKIIKRKITAISKMTLIAILLSGCAKIEATPVDTTTQETIYENIDEENNTISFKDLENINIYYYEKDNSSTFTYKFAEEEENENYKAYYDALSGNLFALDLYIPNEIDKIKYDDYIDNANSIIKVQTLVDYIYSGNYSKLVKDGIDLNKETITKDSLKLLLASYMSYNMEDGKILQQKNMR